ncbi:Uncharacterised protein g8369 [Pycnogonum litorale]
MSNFKCFRITFCATILLLMVVSSLGIKKSSYQKAREAEAAVENRRKCQRHSWNLNVTDVELMNQYKITIPKSWNAYYCKGHCEEYEGLGAVQENEKVIIFPDMIVKKCGCI